MTNEELAVLIRDGRSDLQGVLWEQIEKFVSMKAGIFYRNGAGLIRCEKEDLEQAGFIAMMKAVQDYNPKNGCFLTWYGFFMRRAFMQTAFGLSEKQKRDPLFYAADINGELYEEGGVTLEEITPGNAPDPEQTSLDNVYNLELRSALYAVMDRVLTPREKDVLQRHFVNGETLKACGDVYGLSPEGVRHIKESALRKMRNRGRNKELRDFITERTPYYMRVGVTQFHNSNYSSVERIAEMRERLAKLYIDRHSFTDN